MAGQRISRALCMAAAFALAPVAGLAQQANHANSPILTIDSDYVFTTTFAGQSVSADLEKKLTDLAAENRNIEAALAAEEQALTQKRAELPADEFRTLADAFDAKVQKIRDEQDTKQRDLQAEREAEQQDFVRQVTPILSRIANEYGAVVIIDRRNVLMSAEGIDITDEAIDRINQALAEEAASAPAEDPGNGDATDQSGAAGN